MNSSNDDEFGLDSDDDADLLPLADGIETRYKEKASWRRWASIQTSCTRFRLRRKGSCLLLWLQGIPTEVKASYIKNTGGDSATVVFSMGGGKSLCYQISTIVFTEVDGGARRLGEGCITLVVSPLIAFQLPSWVIARHLPLYQCLSPH